MHTPPIDVPRPRGRACATILATARRAGLTMLLASTFPGAPAAQAQSGALALSTASSAAIVLPVAVSAAVPVVLLASGATLSVVAVHASAAGTQWVLERSADGARAIVRFTGHVSIAAGTALQSTATSAGLLLSAGGRVVALIPDAVGASLLHHEQVSR